MCAVSTTEWLRRGWKSWGVAKDGLFCFAQPEKVFGKDAVVREIGYGCGCELDYVVEIKSEKFDYISIVRV